MIKTAKYSRYPKYKPSGCDWLGNIPIGWNTNKIKHNVLPLEKSNLEASKGRKNGKYPFFTSSKIQNKFIDKAIFNNECLILGTGGFASVHYYMGKFSVSTDCLVLKGYNSIDLKFLYYQVLSSLDIINTLGFWGMGLKHLQKHFFYNMTTCWPEMKVQALIVKYIDQKTAKIDQLIKKNKKLIKLLEEKRQAIITQAVTKGLDLDVGMKESKLGWIGEIPKNWRVMKLKYLVKEKKDAIKTGPFGSDLKRSDYVYAKEIAFAKVYTQKNVIESNLNLGDDCVSKEKYQELIACKLEVDDVVLTTRGTLGKSIIFTDEAELGILHPCLLRVQLDEKQLLKEFFQVLIQESYYFNEQLLYISNATTIEVLYGDALKPMIIALPNLKEQKEIIQYIDYKTLRINSLVEKIKNQNKKLKEYRQTLISNVVTGKIKV